MAAPNKSGSKTVHTEQGVLNETRDDKYDVVAVEMLAENAAGDALVRVKQNLVAGADFDYLGITNDSATQDTLVWKTGGSGGTTVRTLVITYAADASKISDDLSSLAFS